MPRRTKDRRTSARYPSGDNDNDADVDGARFSPSTGALHLSGKHRLLKLRLAPLRTLQRDLEMRIGIQAGADLSEILPEEVEETLLLVMLALEVVLVAAVVSGASLMLLMISALPVGALAPPPPSRERESWTPCASDPASGNGPAPRSDKGGGRARICRAPC